MNCLKLILLTGVIYLTESAANKAQADTELLGSSGVELRYFWQQALYPEQDDVQASVFFEPEIYTSFNDGEDSFVFKPFLRIDSQDHERSHADIRELLWLHVETDWELRAGIGKVFWGQTESLHLVDVINQTDAIEAVDNEEKLGQPMINLALIRDWGTTSFFILPYFRELTFPGIEGRLRPPVPIQTDHPLYESSARQHHVDIAVRWQHTMGDWDVGIAYFDGTARDPLIVSEPADDTEGLRPFYPQMKQWGVDLLAVVDAWLLKFEGIHRHSAGDTFFAAVGGFEYTDVGVFNTRADIGWLLEYQYDERGEAATSFAQNDVVLGSRIALNDIDGTEILLGVIQDLDDTGARSAFVEASSRITSHWKWRLEAYLFSADNTQQDLFLIRRDDFIKFNLEYYF